MTRSAGHHLRLARYGFTDVAAAAALLGPVPDGLGLWDETEAAPVDEAAGELLTALGEAADPALALRQLHRLEEAARRCSVEGPLATMRVDRVVRSALAAVLGASITLGDELVAQPSRWTAVRDLAFDPVAPFGAQVVDSPAALRTAHRNALLRLAAADLTGLSDVDTTMRNLSALADATLAAGLRLAMAERGTNPRLAVIAMGKCGGQELNYVSDVDVIFVCESDVDLVDAQVVAADMMRICGQAAWPVDANLRPEGSQGPLVRTLAAHEAYYRRWARTWEFQALLKARPAAGDLDLGARWLAMVSPLVWQAAERPEAVQDVRAMRRRIIDNVRPEERDREVKLGPGGLRDIEFAVQLLQLVHGRGDERIRSGSTLEALAALTAHGYVGRADGTALGEAYRFLRTVEHRLQLQRMRRTHTVPDGRTPEGAEALRWLAHALGFRGDPRRDAVEAFQAAWLTHAQEVRRLHTKLVYRPLVEAVARVPSDGLRLTPEAASSRLEILGFADPASALRHLEALIGGVSRYASIQHTLLPVLLNELADAPEPDRGLLAYRQVSDALRGTPWFLRLLRDEGAVALRLARLLGLSRYVADLLVHDPEALRLLADDAELVPRSLESLVEGMTAAVDRHGYMGKQGWRGGAGVAVQTVRALRRRELFRIACADLLGLLADSADTSESVVRVGQALADLTDATLGAALRAATGRVRAHELPFTIIGMGRLGGAEMSYSSDADVLFVYDPPPGMAEDAASALAHALAEELRRLLATPAPEPPLGIDADLRPEGRQGPLVRSLAAYERYYASWSKIWEAQALLRARYVAGDRALADRFLALADRVRYPAGGLTAEQVTEIRRIKARVDTERLPRGADPATHAKLGRGGLADVEWAVQLLQLRHGHRIEGLRTTRTLDALAAARDAGLVSTMDAVFLSRGWVMASAVRNALMLVRGRASDQLPRQGTELAGVARALHRPPSIEPGEFLDEHLRTARRARAAAERVFLEDL
ncbi:MAG: bifunctional [glutamine synthetase] adenylyltransferase/[glutamine synthetase]-adenylyl-L-tyrosine phosphorylase [Micromonosporaceae bacterium]|nr:bifunctional [glutamine synthetase] adenylyltransferase/[glutamine synthetase]-adenylyl-L-tyrosine phosphorylase [Micromonosporaceae bacterium]